MLLTWGDGRPVKLRRTSSASASASMDRASEWQARQTSRIIFSLGTEVGVLVVLDGDAILAGDVAFLPWQVAASTADAAPRLPPAGGFQLPQTEVGGVFPGFRVLVGVAGKASFGRGVTDVHRVHVVA